MMAEAWVNRLWFIALATGFVFLHLLPLGPAAGSLSGPELLLALTFSWVMRRPTYAPVALIAIITLLTDFLFMRAPGLWTALVILASESLRFRAARLRELPFYLEWLFAAAAMIFVIMGYRIVMKIVMIGTPSLVQDLLFLLFTIISYPFVALLSQWFLGVRKPGAGEGSTIGKRS